VRNAAHHENRLRWKFAAPPLRGCELPEERRGDFCVLVVAKNVLQLLQGPDEYLRGPTVNVVRTPGVAQAPTPLAELVVVLRRRFFGYAVADLSDSAVTVPDLVRGDIQMGRRAAFERREGPRSKKAMNASTKRV
jgi:hypothetical protein